MSELNELSNTKYAYLRSLSLEELLERLAVAPIPAVSPEKQAYVDALKEAIIEKEDENPTGFFPDVDQQWEQFVTQYLPEIEETALEPERMEHADLAQTKQQSLKVPQKRVVPFRQVWRTALVAAAAIVCMLAIMVTAQAAGVDVFGAMARWTKDVFSFGQIAPDSEVSDNPAQETAGQETEAPGTEFTSLQEAFDAYGMTEVHEPTWLPDGYVLGELDVTYLDDPFRQTFTASYTDGEGYVSISVMSYAGGPAAQVQKTDIQPKVITRYGINFYLIKNASSHIVAWYDGNCEYYVSGNVGDNVLWEVVISMFE